MSQRLKRFEHHRFIGTRDDMIAYDCDDPADFAALSTRVDLEELMSRGLLSGFGPDSLVEATNRGFRARY